MRQVARSLTSLRWFPIVSLSGPNAREVVRWERALSTLLGGCVELTVVAFRIDFGGTARPEPDVTYGTCPRRADTPNPAASDGTDSRGITFHPDPRGKTTPDGALTAPHVRNAWPVETRVTFTENGRWLKHRHNRLIVMPMARPYARPWRPWMGPYLVSKVEASRTIEFLGRPQ